MSTIREITQVLALMAIGFLVVRLIFCVGVNMSWYIEQFSWPIDIFAVFFFSVTLLFFGGVMLVIWEVLRG